MEYIAYFRTTRVELIDNLFQPTHVELTVSVSFERDDDPGTEYDVLKYTQEVELRQLSGFVFDAGWFTHYPGVLFHNLTARMVPLL